MASSTLPPGTPRLLALLASLMLAASMALLSSACGTEEVPIDDPDAGGDAGSDTGGGGSACTEPDPRGCLATGCPAGQACLPDDTLTGCIPSMCSCDEETDTWMCTADCGTPVSCQPDSAPTCAGDDPRNCWQRGCPVDTQCLPTGETGCMPSRCDCDAATGAWSCTDDCRPVAECQSIMPEPTRCEGPNPAGCNATGCPRGQACLPTGAEGCMSSACSCDEATGTWACTADCGPMVACQVDEEPPNPSLCPTTPPDASGTCDVALDSVTCGWGQECCCGACSPSLQCTCRGGTWACLSTDFCFRPSCEGSVCESGTDCELRTGRPGAACVEGVCRDAAQCDLALSADACSERGDQCAWQEPGCGDEVNPITAGCYPSVECGSSADCPMGWDCRPDADVVPECARGEGAVCDACGQQRALCVRSR
jgi:hypothetical protein